MNSSNKFIILFSGGVGVILFLIIAQGNCIVKRSYSLVGNVNTWNEILSFGNELVKCSLHKTFLKLCKTIKMYPA